MAWTKEPELVATAQNIARSVPDRIVAIAFLDDRDRGDPQIVDLADDGRALPATELDGLEPPRPSKPSAGS